MTQRSRHWTTAILAAAVLTTACTDEIPSSDQLLAKTDKCIPQRGDDCAPPPPETVEPNFRGPGKSFVSPVRVATTSSGWLLVSDSDGHVVHRVDPTTLLSGQTLPVAGRPNAVGMLNAQVFVGNVTEQTVEVYSHQGELMGSLGAPGSVAWPADLAVDSALGLVFVLDRAVPEVKIYQIVDWTQTGSIASNGLVTPTGLTLDPVAQEVFVADAGPPGGDASVAIYGYDGTFVQAVSGAGSCGFMGCSGGFSTPASVALDSLGHVYVVDNLLRAVLVYDRATSLTKPARTLGGRDVAGAPVLAFPLDVGVLGGDVLVTSKRGHSLEVFRGGVQ
jgi:hypothetical protein